MNKYGMRYSTIRYWQACARDRRLKMGNAGIRAGMALIVTECKTMPAKDITRRIIQAAEAGLMSDFVKLVNLK